MNSDRPNRSDCGQLLVLIGFAGPGHELACRYIGSLPTSQSEPPKWAAEEPASSTYEFITSLLSAPRDDDQQNIENCYAIRDAARSLFESDGYTRKALSVSNNDWKTLGKIANDSPVVGSRHPGSHDPQEVRPMTNAERDTLFGIAEKIYSGLRDYINAEAETS